MIYGLQKDLDQNQGKGVSLYIPGKTQLTPQDVFLGGPGTGVTDDMLGGSTRIFGETSKGTSLAFDAYTKHQAGDNSAYNQNPRPFEGNDVQAQRNAIIASNDAPRSDWEQGAPTMQRLAMEQGQSQNAVGNAQNAAQLTGRFDNAPTLAQKTYEQNVRNEAIKNAQWDKSFNYNAYNDSANRSIAQQNADNSELSAGITRSGAGTVSGGSMPAEYSSWVNDAATKNGIPPAILAGLIEAESSWNPKIVNKTSGATGLGQFLSTTAADEGLSDRTDAKSSIDATAAYLAKRIQWAGGDLNKGIMGYGEGTTAYLDRVLGKAKNYTVSAGTKTIGAKPNAAPTASDIKIAQNKAIAEVNSMDANGKNESAIWNYMNSIGSELTDKGVDMADLHDYISRRRYSSYDPTGK